VPLQSRANLFFVFCTVMAPYMSTTTTNSTKTLHNKTLLQQNLHASLKSGRYGPSIPVAPLQSRVQLLLLYKDIRPHTRIARKCSEKLINRPLYNETVTWSENRSLWATPSLGAPTIPRKLIMCITYSPPYRSTTKKHSTKILYNKTLLQQIFLAGLKSGRHGPTRPLAPLQSRAN